MIMTKTPFRISFAGGGSDLADFYEQYGGCVLSTSINRYCYISIHPYFDESKTLLKYSENELVGDLSEIRHRIFNCVLNERKLHGVEIVSTADVPGGTGLGSSSTFTVGLINTLNCYQGKYMSKGEIAERACRVEIEKLGSPIGKQDQYAAAYGGLNFIRFHRDGTVSVAPVMMKPETYRRLQQNLMMFYTGDVRSANAILSEQKKNMSSSDKTTNLRQMCALAEDMRTALERDDISGFGRDIEGVEIGVMIRQAPEGGKLSVRTSAGLNASAVCALLGGGGHAAAAGCSVMGTVADAKAAILDAIRRIQQG